MQLDKPYFAICIYDRPDRHDVCDINKMCSSKEWHQVYDILRAVTNIPHLIKKLNGHSLTQFNLLAFQSNEPGIKSHLKMLDEACNLILPQVKNWLNFLHGSRLANLHDITDFIGRQTTTMNLSLLGAYFYWIEKTLLVSLWRFETSSFKIDDEIIHPETIQQLQGTLDNLSVIAEHAATSKRVESERKMFERANRWCEFGVLIDNKKYMLGFNPSEWLYVFEEEKLHIENILEAAMNAWGDKYCQLVKPFITDIKKQLKNNKLAK
jgi:hypothetical protein